MEKTRLSLEQQTDEVRSAVEEKLKTAAAQRDENLKKMVERLREHVSFPRSVCMNGLDTHSSEILIVKYLCMAFKIVLSNVYSFCLNICVKFKIYACVKHT